MDSKHPHTISTMGLIVVPISPRPMYTIVCTAPNSQMCQYIFVRCTKSMRQLYMTQAQSCTYVGSYSYP